MQHALVILQITQIGIGILVYNLNNIQYQSIYSRTTYTGIVLRKAGSQSRYSCVNRDIPATW